MFAFAIWDVRQRLLLLARDRTGEKFLYYHAGPNAFVFGSELRALLEHPAVPRELSLSSLHRYLSFEYVPAPHAILAGIDKLPPGHQLTMSPGGKPRVMPYWDLAFAPDDSIGADEWATTLRQELERSAVARCGRRHSSPRNAPDWKCSRKIYPARGRIFIPISSPARRPPLRPGSRPCCGRRHRTAW
jgi:asparagine synthase (glutamine-hydrolysing)